MTWRNHSANSNSRRNLKQSQSPKSKPLPLLSSSSHRHRSTHWPFLRPSRPLTSISRASLRRRSGTMLNVTGNYFHRSSNKRSHRESSRSRAEQRCNDGRRSRPGDGPDHSDSRCGLIFHRNHGDQACICVDCFCGPDSSDLSLRCETCHVEGMRLFAATGECKAQGILLVS